uniref:Centromere protein K n=1 Tax=Athene cunicularia TaxID=194338 RepID=A0A663N2J8_ATHCN
NVPITMALKNPKQHFVKNQLEMVLSTVQSKNKQLEEDLKRSLNELENKILQLKSVKEELLDALGKFLSDHFPLPETGRSAKKKKKNVKTDMLVNKLMSTPHEPYVTINDSFWPPYIELLLRSGIALRHPEDAKKIRLEAFHM